VRTGGGLPQAAEDRTRCDNAARHDLPQRQCMTWAMANIGMISEETIGATAPPMMMVMAGSMTATKALMAESTRLSWCAVILSSTCGSVPERSPSEIMAVSAAGMSGVSIEGAEKSL